MFCFREQYDKMKKDVTLQDEERTKILEKEKHNVRYIFVVYVCFMGCIAFDIRNGKCLFW